MAAIPLDFLDECKRAVGEAMPYVPWEAMGDADEGYCFTIRRRRVLPPEDVDEVMAWIRRRLIEILVYNIKLMGPRPGWTLDALAVQPVVDDDTAVDHTLWWRVANKSRDCAR